MHRLHCLILGLALCLSACTTTDKPPQVRYSDPEPISTPYVEPPMTLEQYGDYLGL